METYVENQAGVSEGSTRRRWLWTRKGLGDLLKEVLAGLHSEQERRVRAHFKGAMQDLEKTMVARIATLEAELRELKQEPLAVEPSPEEEAGRVFVAALRMGLWQKWPHTWFSTLPEGEFEQGKALIRALVRENPGEAQGHQLKWADQA